MLDIGWGFCKSGFVSGFRVKFSFKKKAFRFFIGKCRV